MKCLLPLPAVQQLREEGETSEDSVQIQVHLNSITSWDLLPSLLWALAVTPGLPRMVPGFVTHAPAGPELPSSISCLQALHELSMKALGELMRGLLEEDPTETWFMEMFHVSSQQEQAELSSLGKREWAK